jgi:hypothetical protein
MTYQSILTRDAVLVHYQGNCICINFNNVPYKDKEFSVFFFSGANQHDVNCKENKSTEPPP